jgi:hypothetical protein
MKTFEERLLFSDEQNQPGWISSSASQLVLLLNEASNGKRASDLIIKYQLNLEGNQLL